jgi:hypothetical protein
MILALEAADSWRLTCSECTPPLQKQRGCKKPGFDLAPGSNVFRFDSPILQPPRGSKEPGLSILYECPTGFVIREAPGIYGLIDAVARDENLSPADRERMSPVYLDAARLYRSEMARLREKREAKQRAQRDADYGARMLKGRA